MPADMQVKLLRVLEETSISRGRRTRRDRHRHPHRLATHRDIDEAIAAQRFREDLFYRLACPDRSAVAR
jgi:sigma-54 specific flagellar transcriptional regulator A